MNALHGKLSKMYWDVPPVDSTNSSLRNHSLKSAATFEIGSTQGQIQPSTFVYIHAQNCVK